MTISRVALGAIAAVLLGAACTLPSTDGPLGLPTAATRTTAPGGTTTPAPTATPSPSPTATPSPSASSSAPGSPSTSPSPTPGTTVTPPRLVLVQATQTALTVRFDRPMRTRLTCGTAGALAGSFDALDSPEIASHYQSVDPVLDEALRSATRATILDDCTGIRLELALPAASGTYAVTVTNVVDLLGNRLDPDHAAASVSIADAERPTVVAADARGRELTVTFSEPMLEIGEGSGVIMSGNYQLDGTALRVEAIACGDRGCRTVRASLASALPAGSVHTLRIANVVDRAGKAITPDPTTLSFTAR